MTYEERRKWIAVLERWDGVATSATISFLPAP
jgi:hypothetical protein